MKHGLESKRTLWLGLAGGLLAALLLAGLSWTQAFARLGVDQRLYDLLLLGRVTHRPPPQAPVPIVIVAIDEDSLADTPARWPWPRTLHAELIRRLHAAGAKVIACDLLFIDPGDPAEDAALAAALAESGRVVLAGKLESTERLAREVDFGVEGVRLVLPLPFFRSKVRTGIVNVAVDRDLTVRRFSPAFAFPEDHLRPHFASAIFELATGAPPLLEAAQEYEIDFLGPAGHFPRIAAADVLQGRVDMGRFRNKIVLVGVTFADAHDSYGTAIGPGQAQLMPGVEIHANIVASMLRGEYIEPVPRWSQMLLACLIAAITCYLVIFRGGLLVAAGCLALALALAGGDLWLMQHQACHFDLSYPLLALPLSYILAGLPLRRRLTLNTQVGPYLLYEELGRGGMAVVYRARHPRTRREVALKQLLGEYAAEPEAVARFFDEIALIRQLNHPNIVHIEDAGQVDGKPYYAMELLRGQSLEQVLEEQFRLSGSDVRRIMAPIARALAQAHAVGVIHRDLKPSNVMLAAGGIPKLMDFGIARRQSAPHLTQAGMVVGTPHYMSPEQCRSQEVTAKSDIYSLGATMYHLLAGVPPFQGASAEEVLRRQINDPVPDVTARSQQVDPALAGLVHQCLAKDPAARPPDMALIARLLDPFYVGEGPVQSPPAPGGTAAPTRILPDGGSVA